MSLLHKYRPKTINDMLLDDSLKNRLDRLKYDLTNLIITGPVGVGKTQAMNCLINDIFSKDIRSVLNINILDKIKATELLQNILSFCKARHFSQFPYKIIIINDFDNVNDKVQKQISIIMDMYKEKVKFIFTSVTSTAIIRQIQSKTLIVLMYYPTDSQLISFASKICKNERMEYDDEAIVKLVRNSRGDIRMLLNNIELLSNKKITIKRIDEIYKFPQSECITGILKLCAKDGLKNVIRRIREIKESGYSSSDIVSELFQTICAGYNEIDMKKKIEMLDEICDTRYDMSSGTETDLQLYNLLCNICE